MNSTPTEKAGKKEKVIHELRQLLAIFLYLAAFFIVLRVYTHLVLLEHQISYVAYGLTILKALVLAKVILMGETLHLGQRFRDKPLIISTVYNTLVFSAFALVFEVVEHFILGAIHGKTLGAVLEEIGEKGWPHLVGMALVVFVAFLPFFAFRAIERAIGDGKLTDLFFKTRDSKTDAASQARVESETDGGRRG